MKPIRKNMRLAGWDYSSDGAYFLTLCTDGRKCLFSKVVGRGILDAPLVKLTKYGELVQEALLYLKDHDPDLTMHKWVIMPNHVHILVSLNSGASGKPRPTDGDGGASRMPRPTTARIPVLVSSIKRFTSKKAGFSLWQQRYYDRIVRNEQEFLQIWQYIDNNPAAWLEDEYFVE